MFLEYNILLKRDCAELLQLILTSVDTSLLTKSFPTSPVSQTPVLPKVMLNIKLLCVRLWYEVASDRTFGPPLESDPLPHVLGYLGSLRMLYYAQAPWDRQSHGLQVILRIWFGDGLNRSDYLSLAKLILVQFAIFAIAW